MNSLRHKNYIIQEVSRGRCVVTKMATILRHFNTEEDFITWCSADKIKYKYIGQGFYQVFK